MFTNDNVNEKSNIKGGCLRERKKKLNNEKRLR